MGAMLQLVWLESAPRGAPRHWYNLLCSVLESPELGLKCCPHDPCIFHGCLIPGKPPIHVAIYADDIIFFSASDEVEQYFQSAFSAKLKVEFLGDAEWYIGIKFDWKKDDAGNVSCQLSQEGYAAPLWKKWVFLQLISLL
jgi:hypothetical protein